MDIPSDSDDSIIFIPYVKPPIPLLVIEDNEVINIDGDKEEIEGPSNQRLHAFSTSSSSYPVKSGTFDNNNASSSTTKDTQNSSLQRYSNQIQEWSNRSNTVRNESNMMNNSTSIITPENNQKTTGKSNNNNKNNNNNRNEIEFYDIDRKGTHGLSTFPYTLTDSEKHTDLLYEKIVNVVRKQKLEKKLMLDRVNQSKHACLEQVKSLQSTSPQKNQQQGQSSIMSIPSSSKHPTTTTTKSTTSVSSSPKKKSTTKRKRDDSGSLSAAELDHYNFLKTLNLTANIGLDENEMLALGRHKTKKPRKKRTKKSNDVIENNNIISHEGQQQTSETLQCKINNVDEPNSVSTSSDLLPHKQGDEKEDITLINPYPSTSTTSTTSTMSNTTTTPSINCNNNNDLSDATVIQFVSIIDESVGKNNNYRKRNVKSSSSFLVNVSSSSLTIPSPSTSTTPVTNKKKVPQEIVIISSESDDDDDEENHGIFTRQELDKLQSNIRLNISGNDGSSKLFNSNTITPRNSQHQASKLQEKLPGKKSFRYFQTTPKTTQQCQDYTQEDDDDDNDSIIESDGESLHENSSCSSTSESIRKSATTTKRTTSKSRFIKNKLKELKRKSNDKTPIQMSKQQKQPKRTKLDDDFVVISESSSASGSDEEGEDSVSSSSSLLIRPISNNKRRKMVEELDSTLSNTSLADRLFPATWTKSMKEFYGQIRDENLDVQDVLSKQPDYRGFWAAPLDPDFLSNFRGRRVKCDNCQQWGHVKNRCPEPVKTPSCLMCGQDMHTTPCFYSNDQRSSKLNRTTPSRCPNTSCLNCGKNGTNRKKSSGSTNRFSQSCEMCSTLSNHHGKTFKTCRNCNQHGHIASVCPEDWRRFHSTTTPDHNMEKIPIPPNAVLQKAQYKSRQDQYCSNCGKKNHLYFNCGAFRDFNSYLPSTPYISNELPLCLKQSMLPVDPTTNTTMTSSSITTNNSNSTPTTSSSSSSSITSKISNDLQYNNKTGSKSSSTETAITTTNEEKESINEFNNNQKSKPQHRNSSSSSNKNQSLQVLGKDSNNSDNSISSTNEAITLSVENSTCKCLDFPDCTNINEKGLTCHSINLSKEEYQIIFKLNEEINVLTQLKTEYQTCSVCLVEKSSSFHLYGNYDDLRDKIFQLLYKLKTEGVKSYIQTVLEESDKNINIETEGKKTQVLETLQVSSSTSTVSNPEISSSSTTFSFLREQDKEHSDPENEVDPVLFHKKTIINDNLNVESTPATVSNINDNKATTSCVNVVESNTQQQDETEIFIEPEIDIIMNRKITITNERALVSSSQGKTVNTDNINSCYEVKALQEENKDDTMISTSEKSVPKSDNFDQIQPKLSSSTTTGDEQQPVPEDNINIGEQGTNQASSPEVSLKNVQNNYYTSDTLSSTLKEVPTTTTPSTSNTCERNYSELPEIIHIDDDDDDDSIIVAEDVSSRTKNKSPKQMDRTHSKSPKRKEKTNNKDTNNVNNNNRKSQEHISPIATIKVNPAEWKQLLQMDSIEFLNNCRDEFSVQISAEKETLSISITNNKWATLLNAKFKIHQWILSKTYNKSNTERREQYTKYNNRHDNRSLKNEEISPSASSSSSSTVAARSHTNTKNHDRDKRRESTNRQQNFQRDFQNNRGNGRGNVRGFRGPRSFKNFNNRTQNGGF